MKFLRVLTLIFSFAFLVPAHAAEVPTVLLFGDSIVAGYGLGKEDALSEKLSASLHKHGVKAKIINGGVSGDTTAGGRSRLSWTLTQYNPDVVVLALGGNDMLRGLPPRMVRENLGAMLKELTADPKRRVLLSSVVAPNNLGTAYQAEFNRIYPELAKQYQIRLYPFLLQNVYGQAQYMQADSMHPNALGAGVIAEGLSDYLRKYYLSH